MYLCGSKTLAKCEPHINIENIGELMCLGR